LQQRWTTAAHTSNYVLAFSSTRSHLLTAQDSGRSFSASVEHRALSYAECCGIAAATHSRRRWRQLHTKPAAYAYVRSLRRSAAAAQASRVLINDPSGTPSVHSPQGEECPDIGELVDAAHKLLSSRVEPASPFLERGVPRSPPRRSERRPRGVESFNCSNRPPGCSRSRPGRHATGSRRWLLPEVALI